jgi:hypothetical protein
MAVTEDNSTLIIAASFASKLLALKITDGGDLVERRTFAEVAGTMDFAPSSVQARAVRVAWRHPKVDLYVESASDGGQYPSARSPWLPARQLATMSHALQTPSERISRRAG